MGGANPGYTGIPTGGGGICIGIPCIPMGIADGGTPIGAIPIGAIAVCCGVNPGGGGGAASAPAN